MDVPDSLNARFELFRSSGRFFKHGAAELFAEESWVQVLLGQGFEAKPIPSRSSCRSRRSSASSNDIAEVVEDVAEDAARPWRVRAPACRPAAAQQAAPTPRRSCTIWRKRIASVAGALGSCPENHNGRELCLRELSARLTSLARRAFVHKQQGCRRCFVTGYTHLGRGASEHDQQQASACERNFRIRSRSGAHGCHRRPTGKT